MKIKKLISGMLVLALSASLLPIAGINAAEYEVENRILYDDFEKYSVSAKPDGITVTGDMDGVYVDTVGTSKCMWLKNNNDVSGVGVKYSFDTIEKQTVNVGLDYLKIGIKRDGDVILSVNSGNKAVVSIETLDGNIVYRTNATEYKILVENYFCNKIYTINLMVNLFDGECKAIINGEEIGEYKFFNKSDSIDSIKIESPYSPGFAVDNILVIISEKASEIAVSGDAFPVIPAYESEEYEYKAIVKNVNGTVLNGVGISWSLVGAPSGVTILQETGSEIKLKVDSTAAPASFKLRATVTGADIKYDYTVTTTPVQATGVKIIGWEDSAVISGRGDEQYEIKYPSYRVTAFDNPENYSFSVEISDQFGNQVSEFGAFKWSLIPASGEEIPSYVTINENTGRVTVSQPPKKEQRITIKATSVDNASVSGTATLLVTDFDTYNADKARIDAVISHVENVVEYGSDNDSPMIADIMVRNLKVPAGIPQQANTVAQYSNAMTQSNLIRTIMNVGAVTGDEKYSQKVYDLYNFLLSDSVYKSMISWGGHTTMDMLTNARHVDSFGGTHEIKGCIPYVEPMFNSNANIEYALDYDAEGNEINGGGYGGYLVRAMVAGHTGGHLDILPFERHWNDGSHASEMESVWKTPEFFDAERMGPVQWDGGAAFLIVGSGIISLMLDYYNGTGDENALAWAENCMQTVINSAYTYYVYKDANGMLIYPSDHDNELRREYTDTAGNVLYRTILPDSVKQHSYDVENAVYEHRDVAMKDSNGEVIRDAAGNPSPIVKVLDNNGNETELILYNSWTEGIFNGPFCTTKGLEYKYRGLDESLGKVWYAVNDTFSSRTGPEYGDRWWNNTIYGTLDPNDKDTWLEQGYVTEEEADLMLEPYMAMRDNACIVECGNAFTTLVDKYSEIGKTDRATELILKYSKSVYNYMKLRYNFDTQYWEGYMTWMRPSYVRENALTGFEPELGEFEEITDKKERYFYTDIGAPHRGYYAEKGSVNAGNMTRPELIAPIAKTIASCRNVADKIEETRPEDAELLRKRSRYMWRVLRDCCNQKIPIGDIGDDIDNLNPALDLSTTANSVDVLDGLMQLYNATGHEDFLKQARVVANNFMISNYSNGEGLFTTGSDYLISTSFEMLPLIIELDAMLLDRWDENIVAKTAQRGSEAYDGYRKSATDGRYTQDNGMLANPANIYPNISVNAKEIELLNEKIELSVGESMKISYKVIPFDAGQGVTWDILDPVVATVNGDTSTIYANSRGITKLRAVSTSNKKVVSKTIEVIVR